MAKFTENPPEIDEEDSDSLQISVADRPLRKEQNPIFANLGRGTNLGYGSKKQISVADDRLWREEQKLIFAKQGKGVDNQNTQSGRKKQISVADRPLSKEHKPIFANQGKGTPFKNFGYGSKKQISVADNRLWGTSRSQSSQNKEKEFTIRILNMI